MNEVLDYIDKCWLDKCLDKIAFYDLETKFGGYQTNRMELIHTIEYARISRRFDDEVYNAIESNAPMEANSLSSTFEPKDVFFN